MPQTIAETAVDTLAQAARLQGMPPSSFSPGERDEALVDQEGDGPVSTVLPATMAASTGGDSKRDPHSRPPSVISEADLTDTPTPLLRALAIALLDTVGGPTLLLSAQPPLRIVGCNRHAARALGEHATIGTEFASVSPDSRLNGTLRAIAHDNKTVTERGVLLAHGAPREARIRISRIGESSTEAFLLLEIHLSRSRMVNS